MRINYISTWSRVRRRRRNPLLAAVAVLAVSGVADAATIELTILSQPYVRADGVHVHLTIRNNGDAAAHELTPSVTFRQVKAVGTAIPRLDPKSSALQTVLVPASDVHRLRGSWPIIIRFAYKDANHHPFEAIHVVNIPFGNEEASGREDGPGVRVQLPGVTLSTTGTLEARLESSLAGDASITFVVPAGLTVRPDRALSVTLAPGSRTVSAIVTNAGATEESRLPIFALAEYDVRGRHETVIASGIVAIGREDDSRATWVLSITLAALIVCVAGMTFAARRLRQL